MADMRIGALVWAILELALESLWLWLLELASLPAAIIPGLLGADPVWFS
jgi:hypothetical protein